MKISNAIQFGRLPNKVEQELKKEQPYFLKNKKNIYFSLGDDSIAKDEYYVLKIGKEGWKIKKDVLQQYMVLRRAISDNYLKYKEQGTLHLDILDFGKHNQYIISEENVGKPGLSHMSQSLLHYDC